MNRSADHVEGPTRTPRPGALAAACRRCVRRLVATVAVVACATAVTGTARAGEPIAPVPPGRSVDFEADILPSLRRSCLSCHNLAQSEGDLVLETPETIRAGGESGPAVVPGKAEESLLFRLAAHHDDPVMPPDVNDRNARRLTGRELGLLAAWIDAGAKGEVRGGRPLARQPPAAARQPVHAVAITPDGLLVAAGRGDRILLHEPATRRVIGPLVDPSLPAGGLGRAGGSHVAGVESLAFSPDGTRLASGDFATVRIWRRSPPQASWRREIADTLTTAVVMGRRAACGCDDGRVLVFQADGSAPPLVLAGHVGRVTALAAAEDGTLVSGGLDGTIRRWDCATGREMGRLDSGTAVTAIAVLPAAGAVAAARADGGLVVWPLPAGPPPAEATGPPAPLAELAARGSGIGPLATVDPQGHRLAAGARDGTVRLYDTKARKEIGRVEAGGIVAALAAAPAAGRLAVGTTSGRATLLEIEPAGGLKVLAKIHADATTDTVEVSDLARQRAALAVTAAREDLESAVKERDAERTAAYTAIIEVAKTEIELAKKTAAIAEPTKALASATEAAATAKAAVESAADPEKAKAETLAKAADEAVNKARQAVEEAETLRKRADEEHQAAKLTVERVGESVVRAVAATAAAQVKHDEAKDRDKQAADELAAATRGLSATSERLDRLAMQTVGIVTDVAADKATAAAIPAEAVRGIEAAARAVDDAEMAAMRSAMQALSLVQQADDARTMAEQTVGEADKAVAGARTAAETAAREVEAATGQVEAAGDDDTKKLRAAELEVARRKASTAKEDLAAAEARLMRITAARDAAADAAKKAQPEAAALTAASDKSLEEARRRFAAAAAAARDTSPAGGGPLIQPQKTNMQRQRAAAALAEARRPIVSLAISADGGELVFCDASGTMLRAAADGRVLGHADTAAGLATAMLADGELLLVGPHVVARWPRHDTWVLERRLGSPTDPGVFRGAVTALAFSPDGGLLAVGGGVASRAGQISLWRTATGERVVEIPEPHGDAVLGLEFSPTGDRLASAAADRSVRVFTVETGSLLQTFEGHAQHVLGVGWRADGRLLASAGADGVVKSWDLVRGEVRRSHPPLAGEVTGIRYLGGTDTLVATAADGRVHSRTSDAGNTNSFTGGDSCLHAIAVSRMGRVIAAGDENGRVHVWDSTGKPLASFDP